MADELRQRRSSISVARERILHPRRMRQHWRLVVGRLAFALGVIGEQEDKDVVRRLPRPNGISTVEEGRIPDQAT
jgi:hypothetical protein